MSIHRSKHPYSNHYELDNHVMEQVEENPYLGVTMHNGLKWASHINKISNKANSVLGFIQRNLEHANRDIKELAYTSLARSILEYSFTVWDPFYRKDIDRLERVQRRAARFVFNDYKPLCSETSMASHPGWKPLTERRREHRLSLFYKIINGLVAISAETHLHFNTRTTRISNSKSLKLPICTTDTFKHSFFPGTIRDWYLLQDDITNHKNLSSCKETICKSRDYIVHHACAPKSWIIFAQ